MHCDCALHEVRELAGHSDIRTTEIYFNRKEEDGEVAAPEDRNSPINEQGRVNRSRPDSMVGWISLTVVASSRDAIGKRCRARSHR